NNEGPEPLEQFVQHDCSDWDFLLCRAEANGLVVMIAGTKVKLVDPLNALSGTALTLTNKQISQLSIRSMHQQAIGKFTAVMHNHDHKAKLFQGEADMSAAAGPVKHTVIPDTKKMDQQRFVGVYGNQNEVNKLASAIATRNKLSQVQGYIDVLGLTSAGLLEKVAIANIPEITSETLITGIEVQVDGSKVTTRLHFGLSEIGFAERHRVHSPPAGNLLPAINGLHMGIVAQEVDEQDRVKIVLPHLGVDKGAEEGKAIWARCMFSHAGKDRGLFFTPQPEDEVLVGFLNDDPRHAVILGSLYPHSQEIKKPEGFGMDKTKMFGSGIVVQPGLSLRFGNEKDKESVTLETTIV
ncbi:MAG: phage baseplate assembly protein V, partial [Psychrosphaera sp.]|nr:phage baseplate assembly protein V [Psychrosphaera sp.]